MIKYLNLSIALARAEFKLKNEGSYLGILWYLLNPLLMFLLLLAVFSKNLGKNISSYPLYLLLGIIIFNYFRIVTTEATRTIYEHRQIIKSIRFPRESLIGSIVFKTLFAHLFEIIVFIILLIAFKMPVTTIIYYPVILFFFLLFIFGASLLLSALTLYFMDLENIWAFASQLLWFATPVFYTIENNVLLSAFNLINPMYYFITVFRQAIIYAQCPAPYLIVGMIISSSLSLCLGLIIFNKYKKKFAELI